MKDKLFFILTTTLLFAAANKYLPTGKTIQDPFRGSKPEYLK